MMNKPNLYIFLDFDGVIHTNSGKRFSQLDNFINVIKKHPDLKLHQDNHQKVHPESLRLGYNNCYFSKQQYH